MITITRKSKRRWSAVKNHIGKEEGGKEGLTNHALYSAALYYIIRYVYSNFIVF